VPGDDVSEDCEELQAVAAALWMPEVIAAYRKTGEAASTTLQIPQVDTATAAKLSDESFHPSSYEEEEA
jgi:hypothetical protein